VAFPLVTVRIGILGSRRERRTAHRGALGCLPSLGGARNCAALSSTRISNASRSLGGHNCPVPEASSADSGPFDPSIGNTIMTIAVRSSPIEDENRGFPAYRCFKRTSVCSLLDANSRKSSSLAAAPLSCNHTAIFYRLHGVMVNRISTAAKSPSEPLRQFGTGQSHGFKTIFGIVLHSSCTISRWLETWALRCERIFSTYIFHARIPPGCQMAY
jgi:hypothetical protein